MSRRHKKSEFYKRRATPGTPPGTIVIPDDAAKPVIRVMAYNETEMIDLTLNNLDDIPGYLARFPVTWVDVDGFGDLAIMQKVAALFNIHPLALEDVINAHQRAKVENYGDRLFFVAHKFFVNDGAPQTEQMSFFLGPNFVLSFQERVDTDALATVRDLLRRNNTGLLRRSGADFLLYSLLDSVVDSAFPVLEVVGDHLDRLEDELLTAPSKKIIEQVHDLRRQLNFMRRIMWPLRDALSLVLGLAGNKMVRDESHLFFRDCQDHTLQIMDVLETYRERASTLTDLYISALSYRMNEVMKVLTVIATIFMPLTFIVGVYGMNFDPQKSPWNMPEIEWRFGYIYVWALMISVAGGMVVYFKRQGWFD